MIEGSRPPISEGSVQTVQIHRERKHGKVEESLISVGTTSEARAYVFLGSTLQVSHYFGIDAAMRSMGFSRPSPRSVNVFVQRDILPSHEMLEGTETDLGLEVIRSKLMDGEEITTGPVVTHTAPGLASTAIHTGIGVYTPLEVIEAPGWILSALDKLTP